MNRSLWQHTVSSPDIPGKHPGLQPWMGCLAALAIFSLASCADNSDKDAAAEIQAAIGKVRAAADGQAKEIAGLKEKIESLEKALKEKPSATAPAPAPPPAPVKPDETAALKAAARSLETEIKSKLEEGQTATVTAPVQMAQITISKAGKIESIIPVALEKNSAGNWKPVMAIEDLLPDQKKKEAKIEVPREHEASGSKPIEGEDGKEGDNETEKKNRKQTGWKWITTPSGDRKLVPVYADGEGGSSSPESPAPPPQPRSSSDQPAPPQPQPKTSASPQAPTAIPSSSTQSLPSPQISGSAQAPTFKKVDETSDPVKFTIPKSSGGGTVPGHWSGPEGARVWVPAAPAGGSAEKPAVPK